MFHKPGAMFNFRSCYDNKAEILSPEVPTLEHPQMDQHRLAGCNKIWNSALSNMECAHQKDTAVCIGQLEETIYHHRQHASCSQHHDLHQAQAGSDPMLAQATNMHERRLHVFWDMYPPKAWICDEQPPIPLVQSGRTIGCQKFHIMTINKEHFRHYIVMKPKMWGFINLFNIQIISPHRFRCIFMGMTLPD